MATFVEVRDEPMHRHQYITPPNIEPYRIRIYDVHIPPNHETLYHRHKYDTVYCFLNPWGQQGKRHFASIDTALSSNTWSSPPGNVPSKAAALLTHFHLPLIHKVKNISNNHMHAVAIELQKWSKDIPSHSSIITEPQFELKWQRPVDTEDIRKNNNNENNNASSLSIRMYKIHLKPNEKTNFIDLKSYSLLLPGDMESTVQLYRQGKGSQICFQGQVTKVEDLIPTNQKWIWMNEHTKFYLHNINETYEFNGWLLEFVSGELESKRFRRNSTSNNNGSNGIVRSITSSIISSLSAGSSMNSNDLYNTNNDSMFTSDIEQIFWNDNMMKMIIEEDDIDSYEHSCCGGGGHHCCETFVLKCDSKM